MGGGYHAPRRHRHGVLVEGLAVALGQAGRSQRERAAEGAAEVVPLGQVALVPGEQLAGTGQQRQLECARPCHRGPLPGARVGPAGVRLALSA